MPTDTLSRFDPPEEAMDSIKGLRAKVTRAWRDLKARPVALTKEEAELLIEAGGGPDPDRSSRTQSYMWWDGGKLKSVVVVSDAQPRCWRL